MTGDGRKGKGGGRVVKNVAGYDLMKLLIGSQGTLAIITGASFKLFPAPRQTRTFVADLRLRPRRLIFAIACCARRCRRFAWSWSRRARDALLPDERAGAWSICRSRRGKRCCAGSLSRGVGDGRDRTRSKAKANATYGGRSRTFRTPCLSGTRVRC